MQEIKAPQKLDIDVAKRYLFLAGSIEMGSAEKWQEKVVRLLHDTKWVILNPRRDDWDSSWEQSITNLDFRNQVNWELDSMRLANKILLYFDKNTKSPISLLELGLFAESGKLVVVCPEGFWKKGNVDVVCYRFGISQADSIEQAIRIL